MHIRKATISNGVYWVEIPAANLRILCGTPEDSVKHLIRKGFIYEVEEGGVTFETGPNAILLSDVFTQGGSFSNVAEFPVLQMLYRQGMMIPDHPNNTGAKPVMIGSEVQVRAQLHYIFRGNYGLVSEDELIAAGLTPDEAREQMRLKLKFAFGTIKPPRDLFDVCVVEDDVTAIRGDVFIQRIAENVFEIAYGGETVEIDLNLEHHETYSPPYHLSYHELKREYFAVVHSGDGDGWDPDRPSMSSIIMFQGRIYMIDAGPNVNNTLRALGISVNEVEGLFLTHAHDDHFAGVTTLMRADRPLQFFATPLVRASAIKKLAALLSVHEEEFENFFAFRNLDQGVWNDVDGLEVKPVFSPHPVETTCLMFRATDTDGYKTYAHWADIVSEKVLRGMVTDDETAPGVDEALFERVRQSYLEPADVKKLDIGGGLIHGQAEDFIDDTSNKIVLAHRATPLTARERLIGAGAPFGTVDVLIRGAQDYTYQKAARLIRAYFPDIQPHTLQSFLNGRVVHYNPESFIGRAGGTCHNPILLLSGQVERLKPDSDIHAQMAAGAIIGEASALDGAPLKDTYRAISFVTALHIPATPFRLFAEDQDLIADIHAHAKSRAFLQSTRIFNDNMSRRMLHDLARTSARITLEDGEALAWNDGGLYLVMDGEVDLTLDGDPRARVAPREHFGESFVLFGVNPVYTAVARGAVTLMRLDGALVAGIPVARWKLLESCQQRLYQIIITADPSDNAFHWHEAYLTGVDEMDRQHQELFDKAGAVLAALSEKADPGIRTARMTELVEAATRHFADEEALIAQLDDHMVAAHRDAHARLHDDIAAMAARLGAGDPISPQEFRSFFLSWIVFHTLGEDRKYAKALAASSPRKAAD